MAPVSGVPRPLIRRALAATTFCDFAINAANH